MKKILYFFALIAAVSCNGSTQDNDPWGKIDDERAKEAAEEKAHQGEVRELSMYSAKMGQTMTYSVWLPGDYDENGEYPFLYLLPCIGILGAYMVLITTPFALTARKKRK